MTGAAPVPVPTGVVSMPNQPSPVAPPMDIPVTAPGMANMYRPPGQGSPIPPPPTGGVGVVRAPGAQPSPNTFNQGAPPPMQPVGQQPTFRLSVSNQTVGPRPGNQLPAGLQPDPHMLRGPGPRGWPQFQAPNQTMAQQGLMSGGMPPQAIFQNVGNAGGFQPIRHFGPGGGAPTTSTSALIDHLNRPTLPLPSHFQGMDNNLGKYIALNVNRKEVIPIIGLKYLLWK